MKYTKKSFTVGALPTEKYRSEWERIFGRPAPQSQPFDTWTCPKCHQIGAGVNHKCPPQPLGTCDHCKTQDVATYHKGGLFLCAKCAGLPPKVPAPPPEVPAPPPKIPAFWTCPDCGGTSSWGAEQLHRCAR